MQSTMVSSAWLSIMIGPVMQRSSVTLAKGCWMTRLGAPGETALPSGFSRRPGTSVQSRSTSSRGSSSAAAASDQRPRRIARGDHGQKSRRALCRDVVDLEDRRLGIGQAVADGEPAAGGNGVQSRLQGAAVGHGLLVRQLVALWIALVFAAA